ncbi:MAG: hypothetical protein ACOCV9_03005 [Marinilabiliaceae bacterium]
MKKEITIHVDTDSLIDFFKDDSAWGTPDKPLIADDFCRINAPDISWEGNKILSLEPDTEYRVSLVSNSKKYPISLIDPSTEEVNGEIKMDMITPKITKLKEWEKVFDLEQTHHEYTLDGHLLLKPTRDNHFLLATPEKIKLHHNIFYTIIFRIGGADKMAVVDPLIRVRTDPDD